MPGGRKAWRDAQNGRTPSRAGRLLRTTALSDTKGAPSPRMRHLTRAQLAKKRLLTINSRDYPGRFSIADRGRRGDVRAVVVGVTGKQGGISGNPAASIAWRIRNALSPRQTKRPDCIVYDAAGTPIATIDAETRVRTPLVVPSAQREAHP